MIRDRARTLAPALLAGLLAAPAAAQDGPHTVPSELAAGLLRVWGPAPDLVVGRAPADFPLVAIPPTARILGGAEGWPASVEMVVVTFPQAPGEAAEAVAAAATGAGWTPMSRPGLARDHVPETRAFCLGGRLLIVMVAARLEGAGSSATMVHVGGPDAQTECNSAAASDRLDAGPSMIPPLYPPANVRSRDGGYSSSGDTQERVAHLETSAGPAELATHYAAALAQAGWTPAESASGEHVVVRTFQRRDAQGREWHGCLTVTALGETAARDVVFRVRQSPSGN